MSKYVRWGRKLVQSSFCEPPLDRPKGTCPHCGGLGLTPESIDEDLYDEMLPCQMCRMYCKRCDNWVRKTGHECKGKR
jgi:hypothetical protein